MVSITPTRPIIVVLTRRGERVDADWLNRLDKVLPGKRLITGGGKAPEGENRGPDDRSPWWQWIGSMPDTDTEDGVVIIESGIELPRLSGKRIERILEDADCPPLTTCPGNHESALNPMAGLEGLPRPEVLDSLVWTAAEPGWSFVHHVPQRFAIVPPGRLEAAVAAAERGVCALYDGLWAHDPALPASAGDYDQPDIRAATGHLRQAAQTLIEGDIDRPLPLFGLDGKPVVLHISHDWGGGVARWIADIIAADLERHHLVLSASGRSDGKLHGEVLKLYAAGPGRAPVRQWTLTPAISGTQTHHERHREALDRVIGRFAVERVVVSSLIGHGLDALATGLPTLQVLHDYYPAWPVLDFDPFAYRQDDGGFDLERAIAENGKGFHFLERRTQAWQALAQDWLEIVQHNQVDLIAPTRHVLERWQALVDDPLDIARVIGHGFGGWTSETPSIAPRRLPDGRLNLVVVGRLSAGKGSGLLEQSLERLTAHARITLIGCGRHGMRFFGRRGVDIILDYAHDALPEYLARVGAQAVLFLSTVPETWNYVLSETRALGLVPIATRTGSFLERIEHGRDGVLFEPDADSLVAAVAKLQADPQRFEAMRQALPEEPDAAAQLAALDVDSERAPGRTDTINHSLIQAQWQAAAADQSDARQQIAALEADRLTLQQDLAERTAWARKQERLTRERTRWAQRLENHDIPQLRAQLEGELESRTRWAQSLERDLDLAQSRIQHLDDELQTIFASRSWKLTRPLRVVNRMADNAVRRRIYNPLRWPKLIARLLHNLRLYGLRGTLDLMQQSDMAGPEPLAPFEPIFEPPPEAPEPVRLETANRPTTSIVIPVFNKLAYTAACLHAIAEETRSHSFEVIVVDDCSTDATAEYLSQCEGLTIVSNDTNSGFIYSCNAGAAVARGEFLVFLNNDTTVTRHWLTALIDTFDHFPDTGIVGARLVYPDGRLQEAGGIVFHDGSGWNYGRGDQPDRPEYSFACEADYVSGACLAIPRETFERAGGFDSHYAPAYYEDTDLCFRVRELGLKVVYQPGCTIVHHEGISSGTDESSGTKRYQAVNREKFVERWREALAGQPDPVPGPEAIDQVRRARHHRSLGRVLVIDAVTPEPDKDSGSMRMEAMLTILRDMGYRVSFMPENLAWTDRYTRNLQQRGVQVLFHPWVTGTEDWLHEHGTALDLVLVSRHYVLAPLIDSIRKHCPNARVIFDTVDLHFLREQRMAELTGDERARRMAEKTRKAELGLIRSSDATLVVSPVERDLLQQALPDADIQVLSNIHHIHGRSRDWSERRDLLFVGGFQHPPNIDAAEWLMDEIMPRVRAELPEVRLHIIGSRMPENLRERSVDGVVLHGYVEDLKPYLEGCRLSVAPLRYGAGVKGKVNQAMAWGLPVVATTCAAEGMYLEDGKDVLLADSSDEFAAAIVRAYSDESLWLALSDGGLVNVECHFSFEAAKSAISELLGSLTQKH
ncbi:glycosyltransferase [Wenzhouxiangella sp. XN201]|uniref:glycosyltransferase n=1 Tax=Wenzhouxiangella sp. XN201 TaxID=2710755 RepID=UPI0013CAC5AB|nr:glycosyltransferase [Wenzhouxiangella sp. XN201]NEZ04655.1 glycosyltransferase [Wenzhouxiangella sp. XN201]